jgi:hypothetical protein
MKKDDDLRIQEILDRKMKGTAHVPFEKVNAEDLQAYELLYDQLAKEPTEHLSMSFKSNVLRRIQVEKKKTSDVLFYWLLGAVCLIGAVVIVSMFFVFKESLAPALSIADRFKGFILLGLVAIFAFNRVEKKLSNG